ncbi:MAG: hypothetical protein CL843_09195 [Crocinitomicaceae bacterium]|nr:hypothetical protein [Crocinitomicaceae bacterium]|tara:strand:- start:4495 stop:5025 length:531 start_codon:yes stop_codon:yes gene_type:complete
MSDKKGFKETKFANFLAKAVKAVPDLAEAAIDVASGDLIGAVQNVGEALNLKTKRANSSEITALKLEFEKLRATFEKEMYDLEIKDRESARNREVDMAKAGKSDWLMYASGITALGVFLFMVIAVILNSKFELGIDDSPLFHQLMGIIEGASLSVFGYYFGTSKSSSDKTKLLSNK